MHTDVRHEPNRLFITFSCQPPISVPNFRLSQQLSLACFEALHPKYGEEVLTWTLLMFAGNADMLVIDERSFTRNMV